MSDELVTPPTRGLAGRPTDYREEYCQQLIDFMASGFSLEAFAGSINVSRQTLYRWKEAHPEFQEAHQLGLAKCQQVWEQIGMDGTVGKYGKNFSAQAYIFNKKNRFNWKDKLEHSGEIDTKITAIKVEIIRGNKTQSE